MLRGLGGNTPGPRHFWHDPMHRRCSWHLDYPASTSAVRIDCALPPRLPPQDQSMTRGFLDRPDCRLYFEVEGHRPLARLRARARRQSPELVAAGAAFPRPLHLRDLRASRLLRRRARRRAGPIRPTMRGDLAALVDHLGASDVRIVAQSMGGWSALDYALAQPARVRALVLASTAGTMAWPAFLFAEPDQVPALGAQSRSGERRSVQASNIHVGRRRAHGARAARAAHYLYRRSMRSAPASTRQRCADA